MTNGAEHVGDVEEQRSLHYSASSAPSVTGISSNPSPTAGGSVVTITGSDSRGRSRFGSVPAASFTVVTNGTIFAVALPSRLGRWTSP